MKKRKVDQLYYILCNFAFTGYLQTQLTPAGFRHLLKPICQEWLTFAGSISTK